MNIINNKDVSIIHSTVLAFIDLSLLISLPSTRDFPCSFFSFSLIASATFVFSSNRKNLTITISLNTKVPITKKTKPKSWSQWKSSVLLWTGTIINQIHINNVRAVSIVALYADDAFLVTVTPNPLKNAIVKQTLILSHMSVVLNA